jgi:hypothetical protein
MLKKYQGGASVKGGFYWNTAELEVVTVDGKNGPLPGGPTQNYLKVPALALIPLAMGFSALYVMFLPFIGFAMVLSLVVRKARSGGTKYHGAANVKGGFYWNIAGREFVTVDGKEGLLPGDPTQKYVKVPTLLFIPLALGMGALYVVSLPFIGFGMLLILIVRKSFGSKGLLNVTRSSVRRLAALTAPEFESRRP